MSDPLDDLQAELDRIASYKEGQTAVKEDAPSGSAVPFAPVYVATEGPDSYVYYELTDDQAIETDVVTFAVASSNRLTGTRNFRAGSDVTYRTIVWLAWRKGSWPKIPSAVETAGPMLRSSIKPWAPAVKDSAGEDFIYKISGYYQFVLDTPQQTTSSFLSGAKPFTKVTTAQRTVDSSIQFTQ